MTKTKSHRHRATEEAILNQQPYQRVPANPVTGSGPDTSSPLAMFKLQTGNEKFQLSVMTFVSLSILLLLYPAASIMGLETDTADFLKDLNQGALIFILIATILFQWAIFLVNYVTVYLEGTGLAGIGLTRLRLVDFAWAGAFFLAAYTLLSGLAWVMAQVGLPMPGEIALLIPTEPFGKVVWVMVSFTAGFCEEVAFRGYIMTRLRILGRFQSWVIPVIVSAITFGICHAYQGLPGFILISVYGALFSLLYIRTGRLWPCIIAHFFQDFGALFLPQ